MINTPLFGSMDKDTGTSVQLFVHINGQPINNREELPSEHENQVLSTLQSAVSMLQMQ